MPKRVTLRAWRRWLTWENAKQSRAAHQKASHAEDWVKDFTDSERQAIEWASEAERDD